jgi:hypothetical protein
MVADLGCRRIAFLLLTETYHSDTDPGYEFNRSIRNASSNGYSNIVELFVKDKRADPSERFNRSDSIDLHIPIVQYFALLVPLGNATIEYR